MQQHAGRQADALDVQVGRRLATSDRLADEHRGEPALLVEHALQQVTDARVAVGLRPGMHDDRAPALLLERGDEDADRRLETSAWIGDAGERSGQLVELGIGLLAADGEEELLLGGEVAIDEADAHARLGGDRRHIGAESRSGEGAACALQDPFADCGGMLGRGLARGSLGEGSGWGRHALSSPWMNIYSFWP